MTDDVDGFSKPTELELLVKARRDELEAMRTETPRSDSSPSTEEKLWSAVQGKLQADRLNEDYDQQTSRNQEQKEEPLRVWGPSVALILPLIGIVMAMGGLDSALGIEGLATRFKYLAIAAAGLGTVAAGMFVWAHQRSAVVDGLAKMLAFSSAMLALIAAVLLLMLDTLT